MKKIQVVSAILLLSVLAMSFIKTNVLTLEKTILLEMEMPFKYRLKKKLFQNSAETYHYYKLKTKKNESIDHITIKFINFSLIEMTNTWKDISMPIMIQKTDSTTKVLLYEDSTYQNIRYIWYYKLFSDKNNKCCISYIICPKDYSFQGADSNELNNIEPYLLQSKAVLIEEKY